jgi:hypothetical protein
MPSSRLRSAVVLALAVGGAALLAACGDREGLTSPVTVVTSPTTPTAPPAGAFDVQVRFVGTGATPRLREAFTRATDRWRQVIVSDIGTTRLNASAGECRDWLPAISESINDLVVYVRTAKIDGPNTVVAQASPCYVNADSKLPIMGFFELDMDDVDPMIAGGVLDDVVLHELGHVLGIGTLWSYRRSLLTGAGTGDPYFTGPAARTAFLGLGGARYLGVPVPVENTGAFGTRDAHWRGTVFEAELMQGFARPGGMPLSRVTVASLADLGYGVAYDAADAFSLFASLRLGTPTATPSPRTSLHDDVARAPLFEVTREGQRRLVRAAPE